MTTLDINSKLLHSNTFGIRYGCNMMRTQKPENIEPCINCCPKKGHRSTNVKFYENIYKRPKYMLKKTKKHKPHYINTKYDPKKRAISLRPLRNRCWEFCSLFRPIFRFQLNTFHILASHYQTIFIAQFKKSTPMAPWIATAPIADWKSIKPLNCKWFSFRKCFPAIKPYRNN